MSTIRRALRYRWLRFRFKARHARRAEMTVLRRRLDGDLAVVQRSLETQRDALRDITRQMEAVQIAANATDDPVFRAALLADLEERIALIKNSLK